MPLKQYSFFGLKISSFKKDDLIAIMHDTVSSSKSRIFYGYSLAVLVYLKKYKDYLETTSQFDVMITDGRMLFLMARFFGLPLQYDISIPRLVLLSLEQANKRGYRVMLIGSTTETNSLAMHKLQESYNGIKLCNGHNGYFNFSEDKDVVELIKKEQPNLLLLGFPTPYKQEFALKLRPQIKNCIIIPCGGMIDVLAGKEKLTPKWIKKIGFASLYRHIQYPKRLPELFKVYLLSVKILGSCWFFKTFTSRKNISIPKMLK